MLWGDLEAGMDSQTLQATFAKQYKYDRVDPNKANERVSLSVRECASFKKIRQFPLFWGIILGRKKTKPHLTLYSTYMVKVMDSEYLLREA